MNKSISFDSSHNDPNDSQVFIALTGSAQFIREQLIKIANEGAEHKPVQGIYIQCGRGVREVKTPIWNGRDY